MSFDYRDYVCLFDALDICRNNIHAMMDLLHDCDANKINGWGSGFPDTLEDIMEALQNAYDTISAPIE